jgi:hypothetical protein
MWLTHWFNSIDDASVAVYFATNAIDGKTYQVKNGGCPR